MAANRTLLASLENQECLVESLSWATQAESEIRLCRVAAFVHHHRDCYSRFAELQHRAEAMLLKMRQYRRPLPQAIERCQSEVDSLRGFVAFALSEREADKQALRQTPVSASTTSDSCSTASTLPRSAATTAVELDPTAPAAWFQCINHAHRLFRASDWDGALKLYDQAADAARTQFAVHPTPAVQMQVQDIQLATAKIEYNRGNGPKALTRLFCFVEVRSDVETAVRGRAGRQSSDDQYALR